MNDSDQEKSNLSHRIMRYGKVSGAMAGLAAKLAGERYLGLKIEREDHAQELLGALGNLKGPLMKVGQILATIPEALPAEYASAFQQLQSNAPPMGWPFVRRRMKTELGPDWQSLFESFPQNATAAASLGQVHKSVTKDGQIVACKLQYPDMTSAIDADLRQLKIIFSVFERYDKAISTKYIYDELKARLYEELDYKREAQYTALFADMLDNTPQAHVPAVVDALSTSRLLTSTWQDGAPIMNYIDAPTEQRNEIAVNLFHAWYTPLYHYGIIHGDPHLGNYTIRDDNSINLLDFGCVRIFPAKFVGGVIDLYRALQHNDDARAVHAYETWGFKNLNKEQIETLNIWARFLYGPILEDKVRPIGEITDGVYGRETAREVHMKLREVGGVTVPREFVFMDRAALGLGSVFLHLKAEVNWYQIFNQMIETFDTDSMQKQQNAILDKHGIENSND
ncbi:MAG: AarF/ABC1/UbiB kinase family protein [Alphaproteobacteria bacterium]|jgi:predicted unusual protein kinase regulating ubiquinone biosynthesis (AarF/ABC1/UbiB family)|nr:AarF/ABC1/UbiB kinase family protein [Alphaproteobacteria bacterium]MDP7221783.1 AarF/ABC1/UbiB kinase family protein [Alphaproteobacteria bacterium]